MQPAHVEDGHDSRSAWIRQGWQVNLRSLKPGRMLQVNWIAEAPMRSVALSTWSEWSGGLRTSSLSVSVVDPTQPWRDQTALFRQVAPRQAVLPIIAPTFRHRAAVCVRRLFMLSLTMPIMTKLVSVPAIPV